MCSTPPPPRLFCSHSNDSRLPRIGPERPSKSTGRPKGSIFLWLQIGITAIEGRHKSCQRWPCDGSPSLSYHCVPTETDKNFCNSGYLLVFWDSVLNYFEATFCKCRACHHCFQNFVLLHTIVHLPGCSSQVSPLWRKERKNVLYLI